MVIKPTAALTIILSACVWSTISSFSLYPHQRGLVPSVVRSEEYYCRQQPDTQFQCWQLENLTLRSGRATRLYDGALETERETMTSEMRKALMQRSSSNFKSPTDSSTPSVNGSNGIPVNGSTVESKRETMTSEMRNALIQRTSSNSQPTPSVNGSNGSPVNGSTALRIDLNDVPQPTANGGFSHTAASRAKIAAANKGKVPWNKGKARSEEVKARIAAGVRARNRERFLQKLKDEGTTEEEYNAKKAEKEAKKERERKARRTANGGYRPTEETKAKISKILKEKHARGEIKRRAVDPAKVRRGFTHSEETRAKISASLKERWAKDPSYRERMKTQSRKAASKEETRKRISATLKKKWKDPEFRTQMLAKMAASDSGKDFKHREEHKKKISDAMKKKWQDAEYREKNLGSISKRAATKRSVKTVRAKKDKGATKGSPSKDDQLTVLRPLTAGGPPREKKRARKKRIVIASSEDDVIKAREPKPKAVKKRAAKKKARKKEPDGSVNRLREERRDLFDLLYGDEDDLSDAVDDEHSEPVGKKSALFDLDLGDEDLDSFDPYGLEDY